MQIEVVKDTAVVNFSAALTKDWLAFNADKKAATVSTYGKAIKNFIEYLGENEIKNPNRTDVINYRESLCASKKVSTARLYLSAVKIFSKWLASNGFYFDFAAGVAAPKLDEMAETHSREALTLDEAKKILSSFNGKRDEKSLRDALIMRIMLNCGLRTIEIVRLDATDIERRHGKIFLKIWGKGRSAKTARVEISKSIYNQILDYLNARNSKRMKGEPMFVSTARRNFGQRLQTQSISKLAKATFRANGIDSETVTAHSCRHTAATLMLANGVDISKVQKILRHKNVSTTEIYRHDITAQNNDGVQVLSDLFDAA